MISLIHTAPGLLVKINYPGVTSALGQKEKIVGYATGLNVRVTQGQKEIYVVDSPFPIELAQAAGASKCSGRMSLFLPKGQTLESLGLVANRILNTETNVASMGASKYFNLRIYDRMTSELVFSCDYCKVGDYSISIQARQIVRCELNFTALYLTPGNNH